MTATTLIGYARCSTETQDLEAQIDGLEELGVETKRIFTDHGLTGRNRERPGLEQALKALRSGDTLVVTKLDRLGRSVPDLRDISAEIQAEGAALSIGGQIHDPNDPMGKLFFNMLATIAEFERDMISQRTKQGLKIAKRKGKLKGGKRKLNDAQIKELRKLYEAEEHSIGDLVDLFGVSKATIYRHARA